MCVCTRVWKRLRLTDCHWLLAVVCQTQANSHAIKVAKCAMAGVFKQNNSFIIYMTQFARTFANACVMRVCVCVRWDSETESLARKLVEKKLFVHWRSSSHLIRVLWQTSLPETLEDSTHSWAHTHAITHTHASASYRSFDRTNISAARHDAARPST